MKRSQQQARVFESPPPRRHNIFALGSGTWDDTATERWAGTDSSCEDDLESPRDLQFLTDAAERVSHEDTRRYAAMRRRRQEQAASVEAKRH